MDVEEFIKRVSIDRVTTFWAEEYTGKDYLVEQKHGDGQKLVWFQTMDSRPFSYYIRVDSSLDLDLADWEILPEEDRDNYGSFSEMLMQLIEEECDDIGSYYELDNGLYTCEQDISEGIEPIKYDFPMLSTGNGYYYNQINLDYSGLIESSIVRRNLLEEPNYSPYCGSDHCTNRNPKTTQNSKTFQFECGCGWTSKFPDIFIKAFKLKWGK